MLTEIRDQQQRACKLHEAPFLHSRSLYQLEIHKEFKIIDLINSSKAARSEVNHHTRFLLNNRQTMMFPNLYTNTTLVPQSLSTLLRVQDNPMSIRLGTWERNFCRTSPLRFWVWPRLRLRLRLTIWLRWWRVVIRLTWPWSHFRR